MKAAIALLRLSMAAVQDAQLSGEQPAACADAEGDEESCMLQVGGNKQQLEQRPCCYALTATCLACSAGQSIERYCKENPATAGCSICAICDSCGGSFPGRAGRTVYFQGKTNMWEGYTEECAGQLRERTGDGAVIFSPEICCNAGVSLLEEKAEEAAMKTEGTQSVAAEQEATICAICQSCGGAFPFTSGVLPVLWNVPWANNAQNYETYSHGCASFKGSETAPPGGQLCCKEEGAVLSQTSAAAGEVGAAPAPAARQGGQCTLCGGSCGGRYPLDGGYLTYAKTGDKFDTMEFKGYAEKCGNQFKVWQSNSLSFNPKLCCAST